MMNKTAQEMGWVNSHFITPHGLDAQGHYTTACELACAWQTMPCKIQNLKKLLAQRLIQ